MVFSEKTGKRKDTPWPSKSETKIQSFTGSIPKIEDGYLGHDQVVFLTPQQLNFSQFSPSDISLDLSASHCKSR